MIDDAFEGFKNIVTEITSKLEGWQTIKILFFPGKLCMSPQSSKPVDISTDMCSPPIHFTYISHEHYLK